MKPLQVVVLVRPRHGGSTCTTIICEEAPHPSRGIVGHWHEVNFSKDVDAVVLALLTRTYDPIR